MPKGIYPRTQNQLKQAKINLALGRTKSARKKATATLQKIAQNQEWKDKVSRATKEAMHRPDIREKHIKALTKYLEENQPNFKGGNGQEETPIIAKLNALLSPEGWKKEYPVKTKGHTTTYIVPPSYKVDFALPEKKIALEVDGTYHSKRNQKVKDKKKQEVLESLGWTVLRLKHN